MRFAAAGLRSAPLGLGIVLLTLASFGVGATGVSAQTPDLSGEWIFTVQSPNGTGTRRATLVQEGDSITGTISSDRASGDVIGAVEDGVVTLNALLMMASGPFEVVYQAEVTDNSMTGTVDFGSYGSGTFTGRKADGPSGGEASDAAEGASPSGEG